MRARARTRHASRGTSASAALDPAVPPAIALLNLPTRQAAPRAALETALDALYDGAETLTQVATAAPLASSTAAPPAQRGRARRAPVPPPPLSQLRGVAEAVAPSQSSIPHTLESTLPSLHSVPIGSIMQQFPQLEQKLVVHPTSAASAAAAAAGTNTTSATDSGRSPDADFAPTELLRRFARLPPPEMDMFNLSDRTRTHEDTERAQRRRATALSSAAHGHSLPLLGVAYERRLLGEAGTFPDPSTPGRRIRFPPCSNGHNCIGMRNGDMQTRLRIGNGLLGFPDDHPGVVLSALILPDEYRSVAQGQPLPRPRLCILCYRIVFADFVYGARWCNDGQMRGVVPPDRRVQQLYANKVDSEDGYNTAYALQPLANAYDYLIAPIAEFRFTLLRMERVAQLGDRWMVNQTVMPCQFRVHVDANAPTGVPVHHF